MDDFLLYSFNLSRICRVCLTECETMFSIYSELFEENSSEPIPRIHEILNKISCIKVQPEDDLPKLICSKCINKAYSSYKFQMQCNQSQSLLDSYIEHLKKFSKKSSTELSTVASEQNNNAENVEIPMTDEKYKTNSTDTLDERKFLPSMEHNFNENESNKKSVEIKEKDFQTNLNKGNEITINLDINKTNFIDFNDDFNSESDVLSFNGEDILKSLDLISNIDDEEELDEDEDCDDLKSCIPLGDETVDQLIKDNLQVDDLDLLTPKMESFNFSLANINKCKKSTLDILKHAEHLSDSNENVKKYCNESLQLETQSERDKETVDQLIKNNLQVNDLDLLNPKMESFNFSLVNNINKCNNKSTLSILKHAEHLSDSTEKKNCNDSLQLETQSEKCFDHFKDLGFNDLSCKSKIQPASFNHLNSPLQFKFENTSKANELHKNNLSLSGKLFETKLLKDSIEEHKVSIPLVESPHQLQGDAILENQLIGKENISSISLQPQSSENVSNEPKSEPGNYNKTPNNDIKSEFDINKPMCKHQISSNNNSLNNVAFKTETVPFLVQTSTQISNVDSQLFNKINNDPQNESVPTKKLNPLGTHTKQTIDLKSLKELANEANSRKMSVDNAINHDVLSNKFILPNKNLMIQPSSEELEHNINVWKSEVIPAEKKFKEFIVSDKCESNLGMSKNTYFSESKLTQLNPTNKQIIHSEFFNPETKIISLNDSPKNYKKGSILLKRHSTNETNIEQLKSIEHLLFKHPTVANIPSKYSTTKKYPTKCANDTFLQIHNIKTIQPTEPYRRIRTFSIKPREPPNMDYYKKEHEDKTVEYECNICPKKFRFAHSLRIHIKNHGLEKPFICTECKKDFKVYGSLVHHSRSHSGEQPYECQICGKRYKQSGTLTAHMRVHTGQKPFECKVCGKGFRQAPDLTYHMRTHTKEKPYMCTVCGKTMSMQCHLVQHMRSHTGEKPFKCSECDKAFPSSTRLKRHIIIHTSLKPFKCKVCNKAYNRNSSLQVHMKVHSSFRSHSCSFCERSFHWAHSLRAHIASHLNENNKKKLEDLPSCKSQFVKKDKEFLTEIKSESVLNKTVSTDSFTLITAEELNELGLDSFQIITVDSANEDTKTFTLYSSESNNDHLSLLNNNCLQLACSL